MRSTAAIFGGLGGVAAGAALMFLLDPRSGGRRRAMVGNKLVHAGHNAAENAHVMAADATHRGRGAMARMRRLFEHGPVDDDVLLARVRARLGQICSHPRGVEVGCRGGRVTLRGPILRREHARVLRRIARVRGVNEVVSELRIYDEPGNVPGLQGGTQPGARRAGRVWSPTTRLLASLGGTGLLTLGALRRDQPALVGAAVGAAVLTRAIFAATPARSRAQH